HRTGPHLGTRPGSCPVIERTLVVTNDFPPRVGGVNAYVSELMRRFAGDDVTVLASGWPGAAAFDARYPAEVIRWKSTSMYPTPAVRKRVAELVRGTRPDVLLFGAAVPLGILGRTIHRHLGVPYATFTHGVEPGAGQVPVAGSVLASTTREAILTTGVSRWAVANLRRAVGPGPRIELLPPGIDGSRFHMNVSDVAIRERHGLDDHPVICCVARLVPRKGQDKVIGALPMILSDIPEARFLVVGPGPDRERLEELARKRRVADRVVFTGEVPLAALPQYFRAGDVFALPNRTRKLGLEAEAFGIAFIEAAAVARPAVAGASGGAPEAVIDGATGLLVDGRKADEVREAIVELLGDREKAAKLGTAGARRVHVEFTWDAMVARLRGLLIGALAGRGE
ncbi:MAG: glycosyltransferase family 4 protein, partial [Actinomycetota bacterium]